MIAAELKELSHGYSVHASGFNSSHYYYVQRSVLMELVR